MGGCLLGNLVESFVDNVCRDLVHPEIGSILHCDLAFGTSEHSGVYVGNSQIVHLNGRGEVECVSPEEFIEGTSAISIYVSSRNGYAVGDSEIALRALSRLSLAAFIAQADGDSPEARAYKTFLTATGKTAEYGRAIMHVMQKITDAQFAGEMDDDEQTAKHLAGLEATQDILQFFFDAYNKLADEASARHESLQAASKKS